ncbi:preprotein translocase subunit SecE [Neisseria sp. S1]|uniref:preprotein translocase subunit SecE n=1 Tax=Neisseria sp. S1 TaxID=3318354 RepID=UPI003A883DFD
MPVSFLFINGCRMTDNTPPEDGLVPRGPARVDSRSVDRQEPRGAGKLVDIFKLGIAIALVLGGLWAFYGFANYPNYIRALFPVFGVVLGLIIIFYWCGFGRSFIRYVHDSVSEFKKVVWPARNDAVRMTMFVIAFVAVLSVFIYLVDALISWLFFDILLKRG